MLVKINGQYIYVYKHNFKYKFELKGHMEQHLCYLAINDNLQYVYVYGYDEECTFNIPQRKIRREIKKLQFD